MKLIEIKVEEREIDEGEKGKLVSQYPNIAFKLVEGGETAVAVKDLGKLKDALESFSIFLAENEEELREMYHRVTAPEDALDEALARIKGEASLGLLFYAIAKLFVKLAEISGYTLSIEDENVFD